MPAVMAPVSIKTSPVPRTQSCLSWATSSRSCSCRTSRIMSTEFIVGFCSAILPSFHACKDTGAEGGNLCSHRQRRIRRGLGVLVVLHRSLLPAPACGGLRCGGRLGLLRGGCCLRAAHFLRARGLASAPCLRFLGLLELGLALQFLVSLPRPATSSEVADKNSRSDFDPHPHEGRMHKGRRAPLIRVDAVQGSLGCAKIPT